MTLSGFRFSPFPYQGLDFEQGGKVAKDAHLLSFLVLPSFYRRWAWFSVGLSWWMYKMKESLNAALEAFKLTKLLLPA
jgi:hypothetical protein